VNIVRSRVPVVELHEVGGVWVVDVFVGHEPTGSGAGWLMDGWIN